MIIDSEYLLDFIKKERKRNIIIYMKVESKNLKIIFRNKWIILDNYIYYIKGYITGNKNNKIDVNNLNKNFFININSKYIDYNKSFANLIENKLKNTCN